MSPVKPGFGTRPIHPCSPFDMKFPKVRNPKDPDQHFFDHLEILKNAAATCAHWGNAVGYTAVQASAVALRAQWTALQLNPWTATFFDGTITPPPKR